MTRPLGIVSKCGDSKPNKHVDVSSTFSFHIPSVRLQFSKDSTSTPHVRKIKEGTLPLGIVKSDTTPPAVRVSLATRMGNDKSLAEADACLAEAKSVASDMGWQIRPVRDKGVQSVLRFECAIVPVVV